METTATQIARQLGKIKVLVVDDEPTMRKVNRALLQAVGVKNTLEAADGRSGLDAICVHAPDIVILDWEMPGLNGPEFMRAVRAPGHFPLPDVPIIMLTGHSEKACVMEAMRLGVNEYLLKPVSSIALLARMVSILTKPRKMLKQGDYYGPEPRSAATYRPDIDPGYSQIVLIN
ncbi:MAG TPA: response regulator [Xanthobacteraceae bacterium]|jgi:CheY-like chemotaxis protein|nr:response regulator [Xanthobacteraceae bacterium]